MKRLVLKITGQVRGGKNNIGMTRSGHRYPKPEWAAWRNEKVAEIRQQIPKWHAPIDSPTEVLFTYGTEDKRRRDMPAIIDAVWHVLEKAGVVADDTHLWIFQSSKTHVKKGCAGVELKLFWK